LSRFNKFNFDYFLQLILLVATALAAGCAGVPEIKPGPPQLAPVVAYALSLQGAPYRYGQESPREGFDCSGFVKHVYEHHGIFLPRTTEEMAETLAKIPQSNLQSGDLVFFNTGGKPFSHVGIYVDHNDFVHAPSRRTGRVKVSSLNNRYWRKRFIGARRPYRFGLTSR
jgi:cell wall-associated NlpC family hydrolase